MDESNANVIYGLVFLGVLLLPMVIALGREHRQGGPITIINLAAIGLVALMPIYGGVASLSSANLVAMGMAILALGGPAALAWLIALAWSTSYQPPKARPPKAAG